MRWIEENLGDLKIKQKTFLCHQNGLRCLSHNSGFLRLHNKEICEENENEWVRDIS